MKTSTVIGTVSLILGAAIIAGGFWVYQYSFTSFAAAEGSSEIHGLQEEKSYGVEIIGRPSTPTVMTDALTHGGESVEVACATCHSTRTPAMTRTSEDLDSFHQGLVMQHGNLSCLSCHNEGNYDTLKLADGTDVGFENAMQLCAQCHGPQYRDYQHGSHGGMNGYWDLSRGPRQRNACMVCHDVHAPAYPQLMPVFPPQDIIPPKNGEHSSH